MTLTTTRFRSAILALIAILAFTPLAAHADTYQLDGLSSDNTQFYGIGASGQVVLYSSLVSCGNPSTGCYKTFMNGLSTGNTDVAPNLTWDYNDVLCNNPTLSSPCVVSDNGWTATIAPESNGLTYDLLVSEGSNPAQLLLSGRGFTNIFAINGLGDIVFDNGLQDEWYEEVNTNTIVTPEPGSFFLFATGILALAIPLRRRLTF